MKRLKYILLLFSIIFSINLSAQCDYYNSVSVSTSGYQTAAGYHQVYVFVDDLTGIIMEVNTSGVFTPTFSGLYRIYAVNYLDPTPPSLVAGSLWSSVETYALANCVDILGPYTGSSVSICEEVCELDDIIVSTTGYHTGAGFQQTYVLVNSSGTILESNTSGTFTGYPDGIYYVYAVNTEETDVVNEISDLGPWAEVNSMMSTYCMDIIGPRVIDHYEYVIPTFNLIGPYCVGDTPDALPGSSTNSPAITGSWSPATISTASDGTTTYTFTPDAGQCATTQTMDITVNPGGTPTFDALGPYCVGDTPDVLPGSSTNSPAITGSWSPATISTATDGTTTYTFTPDAGQCATIETVDIEVNPVLTPTFDVITQYCQGASIPELPTISLNGISGTWSPAINNMVSTVYTFTPDAGECATTTDILIKVDSPVIPDFDPVGPYCEGDAIADLPTMSLNGIPGTWSPAINNTATTEYTFTPDVGECAEVVTLTITVNPIITPTFDPGGTYCEGVAIPDLPTSSTNIPAVTGSWSPAIDNMNTTEYTFTPDAGQCALTTTLTITIENDILPIFTQLGPYCEGDIPDVLPTTSNNIPPITGSWSPAVISTASTGTVTYSFTPDAGLCAILTTMDVIVNALPDVPTATLVQPTCASNTGSITITNPTGAGYEYSINGTDWQSSALFTGLDPGTYTVYVRNNSVDPTCVSEDDFVIDAIPGMPDDPIATLTQPTCAVPTGTITVTHPTGASIEYSLDGVSWQSGTDFPGLADGTYTVYVQDNLGDPTCISDADFVINTAPTVPALPLADLTQPTCVVPDGMISVTSPVGAEYQYSLDGVTWQSDTDFTGLTSGTYTVYVTNNISDPTCVSDDDFVIDNVPPLPDVPTDTLVQPTCASNTGSITITNPTGAGYEYSINGTDWQSATLFTGLDPGTYTVYVRNNSVDPTCVSEDDFVIDAIPGMPDNPLATLIQPTCAVPTGTITVTHPTGASIEYSLDGVSWQSGTDFPGLADGTYTVYVQDNLGDPTCISDGTFVVNAVPSLPANPVATLTQPTCIILTGSIEITNPVGAGIEYSLDGITWQSSSLFSGLSQGNYTVFVRDILVDTTCVSDADFLIDGVPDSPTAVIVESHDVTISGLCNGDATVLASGGDGLYTYLWNDTDSQTTPIATDLCSGNYTVIVTDGNGCTASASIFINEPGVLNLVLSSVMITCFGDCDGSATATVSGGIPPYFYEWNDPSSQTTETAVDLCYGLVGITVYDSNGASASGSVLVNQNAEMISSTTVISNVLCNGDSNGQASVSATGGTGTYTYEWDDPALTTTSSVSGLSAGPYNVTVYDANLCMSVANVYISEPETFVANAIAGDILCNGGTADVFVSGLGGTESYTGTGTFNVTAGTYNYTLTDANGCVANTSVVVDEPESIVVNEITDNALCYGSTGSTTISIVSGGTDPFTIIWQDFSTEFTNSNIPPATNFGYTITDANNCTYNDYVNVSQPNEIQFTVSIVDASCYGYCDGSATVSLLTGGSAPYSYLWSNASTSPTINDLCAGNYSVTVFDSNGCEVYVDFEVGQPDQMQIDVATTAAQCGGAGGTAFTSVVGGSSPYSFTLSGGQSGNPISGLAPGNYLEYVTDDNGCIAEQTFSIGISGNINVTISEITGIACYGDSNGELQATSPNGVLPFNYLWDIPAYTNTVTNLSSGTYSVTISDSWGCEGTSSFTLTDPVSMVINADVSDVKCYGESNGRISITTSNGTPPYTYLWNTGVTGNIITGLSVGTYQVQITDFYGCQINETVTIFQPEELVLSFIMSDVTCNGYRDGAVSLTATGGTPDYNFSVYNGTAYTGGSSHFNMAAGTYNLLVEDNNDCTDSEVIVLSEPSAMTGSFFYSNPSCIGNHDGYIEVVVLGGTEPYIYGWNENFMDISTISGLFEGTYELVVVDANNCLLNLGTTSLKDEDVDCLRIPNAFTPNGDGPNDTWIIENLEIFPGAYVYVYNRWGQELYKGRPGDEWDGKYNGKFVPSGTYLYVVNLYNGSKPYTGTVNVIY